MKVDLSFFSSLEISDHSLLIALIYVVLIALISEVLLFLVFRLFPFLNQSGLCHLLLIWFFTPYQVFDGLENFVDDGLLETIKSIRQCVSGDPQMVIFSDCSGDISTSLVKNLMRRPVSRLSLNNSISTQSACVSQCVHLYTSEGENVSKVCVFMSISSSVTNITITLLYLKVVELVGFLYLGYCLLGR